MPHFLARTRLVWLYCALFASVCLTVGAVGKEPPPALPKVAPPPAIETLEGLRVGPAKHAWRSNYELLGDEIKDLLGGFPLAGRVGVYIEDTGGGTGTPIEIMNHNGESSYAPDTTQILLTAAVLMKYLGAQYRYETVFGYTGVMKGETLQGNLVAVGSGDPTIGGRLGIDASNPKLLFERWAKATREYGILNVTGALIADDSLFDDEFEARGWPLASRGASWMAQVSALSFHENCVDLNWTAGRKRGKSAPCEITPKTRYAILNNRILTAEKDSLPRVRLRREGLSNVIQTSGNLPVKSQYHARASIHNPTQFFSRTLREILLDAGVSIKTSKPVDIQSLTPQPRIVLNTSTTLATHQSPPLSDMLAVALQEPQLFYMDMFLKTVAAREKGEGSFRAGGELMQDFLKLNHLGASGSTFSDGSGRSLENAISPRALAKALTFASRRPGGEVMESAMARPGEAPVLKGWFDDALKAGAKEAGQIRAVAGRRKGVCTLAGYVTTRGGAKIAFAFLTDDPSLETAEVRALYERMALAIAFSEIRRN